MGAAGTITMDSELRADLSGHLETMLPTALMLTRDQNEARDLLQQTALKALVSEGSYAPGTNLRGWLYTIMKNEHRDRRRNAFRRTTEDIEMVPDAVLAQDGDQEGAVFIREADQVLKRLKPHHRATILLAVAGDSIEEIAAALGVKKGTVQSRLWRARDAIRQVAL